MLEVFTHIFTTLEVFTNSLPGIKNDTYKYLILHVLLFINNIRRVSKVTPGRVSKSDGLVQSETMPCHYFPIENA